MCTEPGWLFFGSNSVWQAIANSGYSEPWCSVYQFWWLSIVAAIVVIWVAVSRVSKGFPLLYQRIIQDVQAKSSPDTEFKIRKVWVAMIALLLIFMVSIFGIAISNKPSLLIWSLGVDESQQVYHLSKDGNDYLLGALRQVAYAMLSAWLAALLIVVFILRPPLASAITTIADWFGTMCRGLFAEAEDPTPHDTKDESLAVCRRGIAK